MTEYAPVSPLGGLHELVKAKQLGTYQLLIAPVVLEHSWAYAKFFYEHPGQTIIMDNGVIEKGYPLSGPELAKSIVTVAAGAENGGRLVVVMPDSIDDGRYTVKLARKGFAEFYQAGPPAHVKTMGVVQGTTLEECLACAKGLVDIGVDWLAVPRGLTPNLGTRTVLTRLLAERHKKPMHILGFSDNLEDDIDTAACHDLVQGIDAATPMWMHDILPPTPPQSEAMALALGRRPSGFWLDPVDGLRAATNVRIVRRWLSDALAARISGERLVDQVVP